MIPLSFLEKNQRKGIVFVLLLLHILYLNIILKYYSLTIVPYIMFRNKSTCNEFVSSITDRRNNADPNSTKSKYSFVHARTRRDVNGKEIIVINDESSDSSSTNNECTARKQRKYIISNEICIIDTLS